MTGASAGPFVGRYLGRWGGGAAQGGLPPPPQITHLVGIQTGSCVRTASSKSGRTAAGSCGDTTSDRYLRRGEEGVGGVLSRSFCRPTPTPSPNARAPLERPVLDTREGGRDVHEGARLGGTDLVQEHDPRVGEDDVAASRVGQDAL